MDDTSDWLKLLRSEIPAEAAGEMLIHGIADLKVFMDSDSQTEQRVLDILNRRLTCKIDGDTWDAMHNSLIQYFTEVLAHMLYWIVGVEDATASRMEEVQKLAPAGVVAFLRAVVGVYGSDLSEAFAVWNQSSEDWRTIHRDVYYDKISQDHRIRVRIQKYNGESIVIEAVPDSILRLVSVLMYTARLVGIPGAFGIDAVTAFAEETQLLGEMLTADGKEEEVEGLPEPEET